MADPVNFDSINLDSILSDWLAALREQAVEAVAVLGPDPFGGFEDRHVLCVHPPPAGDAVRALAQSREFGAPWRASDAPLVAWQHIAKGGGAAQASRWRLLALAHGYQTLIRVEFPLPAERAFECFMFSPRELADRGEAACTERTVNYHLANAMAKLKVDNKLAAIQRACWIGAI